MSSSPSADNEKRLQAILQTAVDAIVLIDSRGIIQLFNRAAERLFGYSAEEAIGRNVSLIVSAEHAPNHDAYIQRYLDTGVAHIIGIGREEFGRRKNGEHFPIELSISEVELSGESHFVGVARDITERRRAEEERLLLARSRLSGIQEMIGALAHHWRQPLNAIGLLVQDLRAAYDANELDSDYLHENVDEALRIAQDLSDTIENFRSAVRSGPTPESFSAAEETRRTADLFADLLEGDGVRLELDIQTDARIQGAPGEFFQALSNLIQNARSALEESRPATPRIAITLARDNPLASPDLDSPHAEQRMIAIHVRDNGGGIPEEFRDKIFQPYFTTRESPDAAGLGLYISHAVVERRLGGTLELVDHENGAEFRLKLPETKSTSHTLES